MNREVKVDKAKLIEKIKENKDKYAFLYEETLRLFYIAAKQELQKAIDTIDEKKSDLIVSIRYPRNFIESYESAIQMLEMSIESDYDLDEDEFNTLIRNQWSWRHDFVSTSRAILQNSNGMGPCGISGSTGSEGCSGLDGKFAEFNTENSNSRTYMGMSYEDTLASF